MVRTQSSRASPLLFDRDIDRTIFQARRAIRRRSLDQVPIPFNMGDQNLTLRELTAPNLQNQPLAITVPELDEGVSFEFKPGLIHLLPTFHGLSGEDPNRYLTEFHAVVTSIKPANVTDDQIKLRAFSFSLKDAASEWLYCLPPRKITTWAQLK